MKTKKNLKKSTTSFRMTRQRMMIIGVFAAIVSGVGVFSYYSLIPVNGSIPNIGAPNNHFIKATHSTNSGYIWLSMSSGSAKGIRTNGGGGNIMNPTYDFNMGELESVHVINEDYKTHSAHNFNIDELNVHTKDLGYFQSQTVTFVADKAGTFHYYCTIHPEMKGDITIG
jgi:plastocyanin